MVFLLVLLLLFVAYGVVEYARHRQRLLRIPIRVEVNGTRGKSSVTRLIAAGLRAGGLRVIAKTTGTKPRLIFSDTEEVPVVRLGKPNIIENVRLIRQISRHAPQAIVFECMALVPHYQWVDAHQLIQPTHGVITNARADHLDVMGPTVADVAKALSATIPAQGKFFTAEEEYFPLLKRRAEELGAEVHQAQPETVSDEEMRGFSYVEHKANVALALSVCESLRVDRRRALAGMYRTLPDPGAMRVYNIQDDGKQVTLVNTLAANDPDSIRQLWQMVTNSYGPDRERIVLVNCRADRTDRSRQLAELCAQHFVADYYVATGGLTAIFVRTAIARGLERDKVKSFGDNWPPERVYEAVRALVNGKALLFATGNIVGYGEALINYFVMRAAAKADSGGTGAD